MPTVGTKATVTSAILKILPTAGNVPLYVKCMYKKGRACVRIMENGRVQKKKRKLGRTLKRLHEILTGHIALYQTGL